MFIKIYLIGIVFCLVIAAVGNRICKWYVKSDGDSADAIVNALTVAVLWPLFIIVASMLGFIKLCEFLFIPAERKD